MRDLAEHGPGAPVAARRWPVGGVSNLGTWRPVWQAAWLGLLCSLLSACALAPEHPLQSPSLRLAPADLGAQISLQQRLSVRRAGRSQHADALLQIDGEALQLVLLVGPRRLLTLRWDGQHLQQQRDPALPEALQGERFVNDIQLAYWPAAAVRAALPRGWTLQDSDRLRTLRYGEQTLMLIQYSESTRWLGRIVIERPSADVRLTIDSVAVP